jgi:SAM-dependent methyltransferase
MSPYSKAFYRYVHQKAQESAQQVVPEVLRLVKARSVIDVGCGPGAWLKAFVQCGISDYQGIDSSWVKNELQIPTERFICHDLTRPLTLERTFDLVVCLEVAEHLPAENAESFVNLLTGLGPVILFSAAIPNSGGTRHINEQWPDYWIERFAARNYLVLDCLRKKFWKNPKVAWFYSQNMFLYVHRESLANYPILHELWNHNPEPPLTMVHPDQFIFMNKMNLTLTDIGRGLINTIKIAIKKRLPSCRTKSIFLKDD